MLRGDFMAHMRNLRSFYFRSFPTVRIVGVGKCKLFNVLFCPMGGGGEMVIT